jgi:fermentation-respiration switch protein FrsA (DUF1100 family)
MAQSKRPRRWLKVAIGLVTVPFVLTTLATTATQIIAYVAAHPQRERLPHTPAHRGLAYQDVTFTTGDGIRLKGWFIPSHYSRAAVILGHGFSRSRQELLDVAAMLNRNCYNVLLFDWRAHGESGGVQTTFGYEEVQDLAAALDYLSARPEVDPERIGVLGKSMGAVIVIRGAAALPQIKAVVADSPFPSLQDSIEVSFSRLGPLGLWPLRSIALFIGTRTISIDPDLVRPIDDIAHISPHPVLIMHGGRDELIPADSGQRLYAAAAEPKFLWYEPDVAHVELSTRYPVEYEARIVDFFDRAIKDGAVGHCIVGATAPMASLRP